MLTEKIYYYQTDERFISRSFGMTLFRLIETTRKKQKKKSVVFLCIGSDRSTGDSLGPLVGYKLKCLCKEKSNAEIRILGTLSNPVHALNLEEYLEKVEKFYADCVVVAIDASIGEEDHIGYLTLGLGSLKPGLGVSKDLTSVGDVFITGIVGSKYSFEPFMLQSIRLSLVMQMADCISQGIYFVGNFW